MMAMEITADSRIASGFPASVMQLRLLTPSHALVDAPATKIVCEAENGYFCLLPDMSTSSRR